MNNSMQSGIRLAILTTVLCSCSEDPKLVEKREKQKVEIARLRGDLALIDEKLKYLPPDVSDQLAEAKKEVANQSDELATLETEVTALEVQQRSLQSDFEAYQAKYRVK